MNRWLKLVSNPFFYIRLNCKVLKWYFISKEHIKKFNQLKWIWKHKRCFILWSGPSIKNYNLELLENEDVFVTNRGYFLKEIWLKNITYYVISDKYLYPHDKKNIDRHLKETKYNFFSQVAKDSYTKNDYVFRYKWLIFWEQMSKIFSVFTPKTWMSEWWTVVLDCMNIADYLGYEEVIFLGIDMNYKKGNEHFYADTKKEEKQSFINFQTTSLAFKNARINFEKRGKKLLNATKGSALEELDFIDFNLLFKK